jgi:2-polyprenyl-6-hydroxyphenyl methylase/3-demethylubiquinone-9 3-methyltransferase
MRSGSGINNDFYDQLGERWYEGADHPIALLRAEAVSRNAWVLDGLKAHAAPGARVLDAGCGGGFLTNALAAAGYAAAGVDRSRASLAQARARDATGTASYHAGDLVGLPFPDGAFDAVCAMDVLEHIEALDRAVAELARVLRPGGLFFYYTFNRNPLSWLLAVQGVRWIANAPPNVHVYRLLIKPRELRDLCELHALETEEQSGLRPAFDGALARLVFTRRVREDFRFVPSRSLAVGYLGRARKRARI